MRRLVLVLLVVACAPKPESKPPAVTVPPADESGENGPALTITLVPLSKEHPIARPITARLEPAGIESEWPGAGPIEIISVPPGKHTIRLRGALADPVEVEIRPGAAQSARVRALPIGAYPKFEGQPYPEKVFVIDTTQPDRFDYFWREGDTNVELGTFARDADTLRRNVAEQWDVNGAHRASTDPKFDRAVLLVDDKTSPSEALAWLEAVSSFTRRWESTKRSAFQVTLVPAEAARRQKPKTDPASLPAPPAGASVELGLISVSGRLPPEKIRSVIEGQRDRFQRCYGVGLKENPTLAGSMLVRFVIGVDGGLANVSQTETEIAHPETAACVLSAFQWMEFPRPGGGVVTVVAPLRFAPR